MSAIITKVIANLGLRSFRACLKSRQAEADIPVLREPNRSVLWYVRIGSAENRHRCPAW